MPHTSQIYYSWSGLQTIFSVESDWGKKAQRTLPPIPDALLQSATGVCFRRIPSPTLIRDIVLHSGAEVNFELSGIDWTTEFGMILLSVFGVPSRVV